MGVAGMAPKVQGGGGLESADCRPAFGSSTSMRQDASWWPGAHTSAPKAPSTYAAESRSEVSQGSGGWASKQTGDRCAGLVQMGDPKTDGWEQKSRKGNGSGNRPDPEKLVPLNYPGHPATPLLHHISRHISRHDSHHDSRHLRNGNGLEVFF